MFIDYNPQRLLPPGVITDTRYVELLARFGGRMTIHTCEMCSGEYDEQREHCPYCGARRYFICSHSYEPLKTRITYRDSTSGMRREMLKAYHTTHYAHRERRIDVRDCDGERAIL